LEIQTFIAHFRTFALFERAIVRSSHILSHIWKVQKKCNHTITHFWKERPKSAITQSHFLKERPKSVIAQSHFLKERPKSAIAQLHFLKERPKSALAHSHFLNEWQKVRSHNCTFEKSECAKMCEKSANCPTSRIGQSPILKICDCSFQRAKKVQLGNSHFFSTFSHICSFKKCDRTNALFRRAT